MRNEKNLWEYFFKNDRKSATFGSGPRPDFDPDNPTNSVCSFILAALPSLQLHTCVSGGAIIYRFKAQSIVALSSTEAELIAAVITANTAQFLRSALRELGFPQDSPTPIYEDNKSAIDIVNAFTYSGGVIVYRSKAQSIVALSSTEAELIATVTAAKTDRFLRSVLRELGFPQDNPTPIYKENISAIDIVNSNKPTERS